LRRVPSLSARSTRRVEVVNDVGLEGPQHLVGSPRTRQQRAFHEALVAVEGIRVLAGEVDVDVGRVALVMVVEAVASGIGRLWDRPTKKGSEISL